MFLLVFVRFSTFSHSWNPLGRSGDALGTLGGVLGALLCMFYAFLRFLVRFCMVLRVFV